MLTKIPQDKILCDNFIGGAWVKGTQGQTEILSPYNGKVIGVASTPTTIQVKEAIQFAHSAQKDWGRTPLKERSKVLFNFRNIMLQNLDEIAHLKASESGKTFEEGKAGLMKGIEVLEFALSLQNLDLGGKVEVSRGRRQHHTLQLSGHGSDVDHSYRNRLRERLRLEAFG